MVERPGGGSDGRHELRQVFRDLLELNLQGGLTGDNLLLLLSLVNILGVIELLGRRQGNGEGQFFQRLLGPLFSAVTAPVQAGKDEGNQKGLRAVPGGKDLMSIFGGKDGLRTLMSLLNNREVLDMVIPLLQRLGSASPPVSKAPDEGGKEAPAVRKSHGREVIHWDFGRNDPGRDKEH
ncbi:MAG: hypothetical protein AB1374_09965 [Bacillota bacterium]